jgi:hypothetical protein
VVAVVILGAGAWWLVVERSDGGRDCPADPAPLEPADALQRLAVSRLDTFTEWLARGEAHGWIGEVGWPDDDQRWNDLGEVWRSHADASGLWVTAWAAGEWWGDEPLAVYRARGGVLSEPAPQAAVFEPWCGGPGADRGVNVNGGEFGIGDNLGAGEGDPFSAANPGVYGVDYQYDSQASFDYLSARGVEVVRLAFRWERLQPMVSGPLAAAELDRLRSAIDRADRAGLQVIPTPMNYGARWEDSDGAGRRHPLGSTLLSVEALADFWSRLVGELDRHETVMAWGLMNEPADLPGGASTWERASQLAVDAIRSAGSIRTIAVPTYDWSSIHRVAGAHPTGPWIFDPVGNVRYEAHQYFDVDGDGAYDVYDDELVLAEEEV